MRTTMVAIGYLSTATVLSLVIGVGYLWQTRRLDDDKMFRIVALVHDVDIEAIEAEQQQKDQGTPPEEPSLEDIESYQAVFSRNFEVKQDALKRGKDAFDHSFRRLETATAHFSELATKIETELKSQGELSSKEAVSKVVRNLELMGADQAKEDLMRTLGEPEGMKDVILLINAMSTAKLKAILKKFRTPQELDALHQIHKLMLDGGPQAAAMNEALKEIEDLKSQR